MKITPTRLADVLLVESDVYEDDRGFFLESWHRANYAAFGLNVDFVQDNHSRSRKGVLRGLHYQLHRPQGKLVRVTAGAVFDVAVDIREGSPTFGQWVGAELSDSNRHQLYIPPGFAHGFCVLSAHADFLYKCTEYYEPGDEYGIIWNDPAIGITWPGDRFTLSVKDANNKCIAEMRDVLPSYECPS